MKIKDILQNASIKLRDFENPKLDANILLCHLLNCSKEYIFLNMEQILNEELIGEFDGLVSRRMKGEPIAKIIGYKYFWNSKFFTNTHTLDPRPDSETLIELCLELLQDDFKVKNIIDLGTGTGCLIISLLQEIPGSFGVAVDISQDGLNLAKRNILELGLQDRIKLIQSNWFESVSKDIKFDLIISNPPYIPSSDVSQLKNEVKNFDPLLALDGGIDGLRDYKIIAKQAKYFMHVDSLIILEIGINQEEDIINIFTELGYDMVRSKKDLGNITRVVSFKIR